MDITNWIVGLMRHNYEAVGFVTEPTVRDRYVALGRYVLQTDERGKAVGYLLHGPCKPGRTMTIIQHCIELDKRNRGYGQAAVQEVVRRAKLLNAAGIRLRVASDLEAVQFWQSCGFVPYDVVPGGKKRNRMIIKMCLDLSPMVSLIALRVGSLRDNDDVTK